MQIDFNHLGVCEIFGMNSILRGLRAYPFYLHFAETEIGDRILDAGSGFGSIFFGAWGYKGLELIAMDSSVRMTQYTNSIKRVMDVLSDTNRRFVVNASSSSIPLDDATIDTIIDVYSLVYIPTSGRKRAILEEYRRILKPKGSMVIVPRRNRDMTEAVEDTFHSYTKPGIFVNLLTESPLKVVKE